jgi:predicted transcriptional regulator
MIDFACRRFDLEEVIRCGLGLSRTDYKILKHLVETGETIDSKSISGILKIDLSTAQRSLKKLRELELLKRQQVNLPSGGYNLKYSSVEKEEISKILESIVDGWSKKVKAELINWTN